ncbi:type II toxin-antitoxin system YafQ family toxin [Facilibium subflavum]|uniref:type II toxin-antitoxin system YafQ family toxin n=1 Tax=Facilibium subflavum TaxID=2219058 RepID=UPI000E64E9A5|nr:type II toxin-antitoxin system YafQ family toxin [Facilibium subflavum]
MRMIERANTFKKDYKRESKGKYRTQLSQILPIILNHLANDLPLEPKLRDHDLIGNWQGYRECHLKPDLLLIYRKENDDILKLARLGSHSEIFG